MNNAKYSNITAVLVHAAWADASSWNILTPSLLDLGMRVRSAQLPLSSLSEDVAALNRLLRKVDGPIVLVGHSYAGAVITAAGADNPQIKRLFTSRRSRPTKPRRSAIYSIAPSPTPTRALNLRPMRTVFSGCLKARSPMPLHRTHWKRKPN